jgi:type IV pilus assembly protein PilB
VPADRSPSALREGRAGADPVPARDARPEGDRLGAILLRGDVITAEQLDSALEQQKKTRRRIGHVLIDMAITTKDAVLGALGLQLGLPTATINAYTIDSTAIKALPEKVARLHSAFPVAKVGTTLTVAVATPLNLQAVDDLRFASGCEVRMVIALEDEIQAALDRYYQSDYLPYQLETAQDAVTVEAFVERRDPTRPDRREGRGGGRRATDLDDPDEISEAAERSAVTVLNRLLARASTDGASDIHVEPMQDLLRVRMRVDGAFRDVGLFPPTLAAALAARIKVLAGMDIAEHRLPQDGRFTATVGDKRMDLRTATYPTLYGEKLVLRILDRSQFRVTLQGMGMRGRTLELFRDLVRRPEGMLLITGPTGSGKTSTLYGALAELVETNRHIITVEDPVEYAMPGIVQGQTNEKTGFTFARGLRAILRQDPDVIMVGEIRDSETLQTALEASLTGHLVLSTLHTNSAVATPARLLDMGAEPYLLSSSLLGVLAQRLVRRICPTCRVQIPLPSGVTHLFVRDPPEHLYRGKGCGDCRGSGYRGRFAIHELLVMDQQLRDLVLERAPESRIADVAWRNGTAFLREACLQHVIDGDTTLEEVMRVTQQRN